MIRAISYCISVIVKINIVLLLASQLFAQSVSYDCPAVAAAKVLQLSRSNKIVEVELPVSVSNLDSRLNLEELKVEVFWNRNAYPVVDFSPRTQMSSDFDGPITVEKKSENSFEIGANASSSYLEFVTPGLNADLKSKKSESRTYNEIPEQRLLVASGTARRGTGAFFTFKNSPIETLEGDRRLVMAFDVPVSWRGGIMQVTIKTVGRRKKFASFYDNFELSRVFMLGLYEDGDEAARLYAGTFARSEQQLRADWERFTKRQQSSAQQFERFFSGQSSSISPLWVHQLIQSGNDNAIRRVGKQLPSSVAITANEFIVARRDLLAISK